MESSRIRNFCIIAHIDHGKSTLADRFLEQTGTIARRDMGAQVLDAMDLEREKGVTIKAKAVRMSFKAKDGVDYELNLIDTPGHVDFGYEVSRALAACEGAVLVVDAAQGIQAQTLANVYLALDADLTLIPVVNKIDLPSAEPERVAQELVDTLGFSRDEILFASAKEGTGTHEILDRLTEEGYLVLRVDDRGVGQSKGPLKDIGFDGLIADARACVEYLLEREDVDPGRVAVIGHSEGGETAPILARELPEIAAIVLMAAPGRLLRCSPRGATWIGARPRWPRCWSSLGRRRSRPSATPSRGSAPERSPWPGCPSPGSCSWWRCRSCGSGCQPAGTGRGCWGARSSARPPTTCC